MALNGQCDGGWADAGFLCSKNVFGCGGQGNNWASTPDDLAYFCRGEEQRSLYVSQTSCSLYGGRKIWHLGDRNDSSRNQIPVISQFEGDDGFHLQDVTVVLIDSSVRVEVILQRYRDHVSNGILGLLGYLGCPLSRGLLCAGWHG